VRIAAASGRRVECLRVGLWLRIDSDRRDIVLGAGDGFSVDRRDDVLIMAFENSEFLVLDRNPAVRSVIERVPTQLIDVWTLDCGQRVTLRPVLPQDTDLGQGLVRGLSPGARYQRLFTPIAESSPASLARMTQIDHRQHVVVIAEAFDAAPAVPLGEASVSTPTGRVPNSRSSWARAGSPRPSRAGRSAPCCATRAPSGPRGCTARRSPETLR
jgi:hypothetical protein